MALLTLDNLSKGYGDEPAVNNVSLSLDRGHILGMLGPSGCGKTTLLRLVAGLEPPETGRVHFDGKDVTDLAPHRRNFGLMFQEFALFPHKSVFDNVAFGPLMQKQTPAQIHRRTEEMLSLVGLTGLARRNVADLSGGERQRVALARSLAPRPRLLMLDEPLGALDRALRERLLVDIRSILKRLDMTAIFVTHDQSEALAVADRVAVMHQGGIEQVDPPEEVYLRPKTTFVARFLGFNNLLTGKINDNGGVETALGILHPPGVRTKPRQTVTLVLRPEGARLAGHDAASSRLPKIAGTVVSRLFNGQVYRVSVSTTGGLVLVFDLPNAHPPPLTGEPITLNLQSSQLVVIPAENNKRQIPNTK